MACKIKCIGSGSGLNPEFNNTSFLISGNGRTLLIDSGGSVLLRLIKSGELEKITDIAITHCHADHIGGIEGIGFMNYFSYRRKDSTRPNIYFATATMAQRVWNSLREGMETGDRWNEATLRLNQKFKGDFPRLEKIGIERGLFKPFKLQDYFKINVGMKHHPRGLPPSSFFPTPHAPFMENYGLRFGKNGEIYYSGDTIELPPFDPKTIFQDCQFFEGGVHISYDKLKKELPPSVKEKTYLVGARHDECRPEQDGFAGFVKPGYDFSI